MRKSGILINCSLSALSFATTAIAHTWANRHIGDNTPASLVLNLQQIHHSLQTFIDAQDQRSFRHLGDPRDFDHGHLLYTDELPPDENGHLQAFAILYHTQENAFQFHREDPGGAFDYLDREGRNWLHFLDLSNVTPPEPRVQNAFWFMADFFPDTPGALAGLAATRERYTVSAEQFDSAKFPPGYRYHVVGQRQFEFMPIDCESSREPLWVLSELGKISVTRPRCGDSANERPTVCLFVKAQPMYVANAVAETEPTKPNLKNPHIPEKFRQR